MFNPTREEVRRFFVDAWAKRLAGRLLTPLEHQAADIVTQHPEYQPLLAAGAEVLQQDFPPEAGRTNPFLHLSLHLAIEEQLAIDQPPGIRELFAALMARRDERHAALHDALECLGETVWRAQRDGQPPDGEAYLDCLRRRLG